MIARVATAVLSVADQDRMAAFFTGRLGFTVVRDAEMWPGARWLEVAPPDGGTSVVLSAAKDFDREPDTAYPMTFECDDLDGTVGELRAAGLQVGDPVAEAWGRFVQIPDPEGRLLLVKERSR